MSNAKNIQLLPAPLDLLRVETGAVQFGDDWPGLFIRGDNAIALMIDIQLVHKLLASHESEKVRDLAEKLLSYAHLIEEDVKASQHYAGPTAPE